MRKFILIAMTLLCVCNQGFTQTKIPQNPAAGPSQAGSNPNAMNKGSAMPQAGPKPYGQVITDKAKTEKGLFKIHQVEDRYFFEIPDSLLGREMLIVNRISKAAAGNRAQMIGYGGDQIGENVISFDKGPSNKLYIKSISFSERSIDTTEQGLYRSMKNSNIQPLVASFDVKAYANDSVAKVKGTVIDVTDYMNGDNDIFFFDMNSKRSLSLTTLFSDRSYIKEIRAFQLNIEIRTLKTYMKSPPASPLMIPGAAQPAATAVTYELNSSMVLLPSKPMKARNYDPRVGYFATGFVDFDANPQGVTTQALITRWRLEPKAEDIERYKRGELVEPKKQIIYYIDPATPKKWVPFLIQGVNDWQVAFEKAGFKNAIVAKPAPNDPTWNIDDARHNVIVYKPSDIANASGPHVHDPRTGEIIETHINWYHNIMQVLRNWYFIQASAIDPKARKIKFDDKLMGELIRFVSSHEVGHTLGLRHNFGSSATVSVEKLRDKQWVEANGHTPSIMDYARFNYVAQPEDNISARGIFPRIGAYDLWAIEWGYRWLPQFKSPDAETRYSNKTIIKRITANPYLRFGTETDFNDPRNQNEDLGDNAMLASAYGIKNLKRILPNILKWTEEPDGGYLNARTLYGELIAQYNRYIGHVGKNVAGILTSPKTVEEKGPVYESVPAERQKQAVAFLNDQLFSTPNWLINSDLMERTGMTATELFQSIQKATLSRLQSPYTLFKLINDEAAIGTAAYTTEMLFNDLQAGIWSELSSKTDIDVYRRNLQKTYIDNLIKLTVAPAPSPGASSQLIRPVDPTMSDLSSISRGHLQQLADRIAKAIPDASGMSKYHLQDIMVRITSALSPKASPF